MYKGKLFYEDSNFKLINDDYFNVFKDFDDKIFDMIFADPPYFLSNNGITCSGGKMVSVNKEKKLSKSDGEIYYREDDVEKSLLQFIKDLVSYDYTIQKKICYERKYYGKS